MTVDVTYVEPTTLGIVSCLACAGIFVHAVCQAARVKHRITEPVMWMWVALAGASLWAGVDALRVAPKPHEVALNVAFSLLCMRVAIKIWRHLN